MTTPEELNTVLRAFQQSRTVLTALELDLFTHLQGGGTAGDVARAAGTDERATGMLLNALASLGVVRLHRGGYENTELSRTFVEGEPGQAREAALHLAFLWRRWSTLTECVRAGTRRPDLWGDADDELRTRSFIAAMNRNAAERVPHVVAALKP
jgi:Dimerisation domain